MSPFGEALGELAELGPISTDKFATSIKEEWILAALAATGSASTRRRKLPAEKAVWLVLGMGLYADHSIDQVVDHLDLMMPGAQSLARSAIPKARYRLGPEPLRWLFRKTAETWRRAVSQPGYRGLSLFAVDGSCMKVPDTNENFEHFGKPGGRAGSNDAGYPQLRIACLMALRERLLVDACFGPYRTSEQHLTAELWPQVPDKSLTILDRGFVDYSLFASLLGNGQERHLLVRVRDDLKPEPVKELADGSLLMRLKPRRELRAEKPDLPSEIIGRVLSYKHPDGAPSRLFTTLVDDVKYPAEELIELYHERWEIELGYDEFKTHMLERKECLRSKKPAGIEQELWGLLLIYNLVRFELAETAATLALPPKRMSFRHAVICMRSLWEVTAWRSSPATIPKKLAEVRSRCALFVLPPRRTERRYPRHMKVVTGRYPRNRGKRPIGLSVDVTGPTVSDAHSGVRPLAPQADKPPAYERVRVTAP